MNTRLFQKLQKLFFFSLSSYGTFFLFLEVCLGIFLCLSSLILFIEIGEEVLEQETLFLDTVISHAIYSLRQPWLTQIMRLFSFLGGEFTTFASLCIALFFLKKKHIQEALLFSITVFGGNLLNVGLKMVFRVPRPAIDPIYIEKYYSFPSGHAMGSFIFYASFAYFFYHFTRKRKYSLIVSAFSAVMIFLVGFSRVYLGVHYPSDILAGFIVGFWWVVTAVLIDKTVYFYRLYRKQHPRA